MRLLEVRAVPDPSLDRCQGPRTSQSGRDVESPQIAAGMDTNGLGEEKRGGVNRQKSPAAAPPSRETPIRYIYLTFDTPLPTPNAGGGIGDLPSCPDLSRYTNPLTWPKFRKDIMLFLSCIATCITAYAAGAYSQAADLIANELHTTHEGALVGVTTFCLGFALAPMILAPFSEINGRYPVFAVSGVVFTVFQAVCGVVTNLAGMLIARFFTGVGGSVFSTMVGGIITDMYEKEHRNTPMALFSGSVLVGTGLGPLVAAVMVQQWGSDGQKWKWVFWHQVIMDFILMVAIAVLFNESRGGVLLSRKAKTLNKWYEELEGAGVFGIWMQHDLEAAFADRKSEGTYDCSDVEKGMSSSTPGPRRQVPRQRLERIRWIVKEDEERASLTTLITVSLVRPFHFLFTEPIVFFFSLWVSFAWAVLYLTFGSIPLVFSRQYNFDVMHSGLVFAAIIVGSVIATVIGICQETLLKHPEWQKRDQDVTGTESDGTEKGDSRSSHVFWAFVRRRFPVESPESRLYFTCLTSILLPIGLYLFGFSAEPSTHWISPTIAIGLASMGIYYVYLATFNYLADIYRAYASSALAAQSFCRNVLGGIFPLVTGMLIRNLGEDATGGLLGAIATALSIVPWILVFYGERIRRRSKFAIALESSK
ncbi:major facilitator superfamily domain-containing protein [Xylariomycetidae sp. FL2044]|nr:major facilitator superfamily domain-containing protein [Xylariomycetidae sp. FL2044]